MLWFLADHFVEWYQRCCRNSLKRLFLLTTVVYLLLLHDRVVNLHMYYSTFSGLWISLSSASYLMEHQIPDQRLHFNVNLHGLLVPLLLSHYPSYYLAVDLYSSSCLSLCISISVHKECIPQTLAFVWMCHCVHILRGNVWDVGRCVSGSACVYMCI